MMIRKARVAVALGTISVLAVAGFDSSASASSPVALSIPQGTAFTILGYWCGGIQEHPYATGFDPTSGYPTGDVHLQTTCNGSGRGGHSITHTAWAAATWDFTGAVVSASAVQAPTVDPTFSAYDANGNEVYNTAISPFALLQLAPGFVPAARVTGMSPSEGPASGGTSVTITGDGFTGATAVDFGSVAASFVFNSDTSITALSPMSDAGAVHVTVVNAGGTSASSTADEFIFIGQPSITKVDPNSGPLNGGTSVTITGNNLSAVTSMLLGDTAVGFYANSDTSITVITPPGEQLDTLAFQATSLGGTSASTPADLFTFVANPVPKTAISPKLGPKGTAVTVSGTGFSPGETVKATYKTGLASPKPAWIKVCSAVVASNGGFSCKGAIPTTNAGALGTHTIFSEGLSSLRKATTSFSLN